MNIEDDVEAFQDAVFALFNNQNKERERKIVEATRNISTPNFEETIEPLMR